MSRVCQLIIAFCNIEFTAVNAAGIRQNIAGKTRLEPEQGRTNLARSPAGRAERRPNL
jgi:hypothetical protein